MARKLDKQKAITMRKKGMSYSQKLLIFGKKSLE
jgi:hypothetical protein